VRRGSRARPARSAVYLVVAAAGLLIAPTGCASRRAAARFTPASEAQVREALDAWSSIRARAEALPATRLLYDARMAGKGAPSLPGTLAVTYDGADVTRASLTGPFGKPVAEYAGGEITGGGRAPFPVDPRILKSVLAGSWPGEPASVAGCDAESCLLVFPGAIRAEAVLDRAAGRLSSLRITGEAGALAVTYEGAAPAPWPERIAVEEEKASRRLGLRLVAAEPGASPAPRPPGGAAP
jgi:hypothetical protein